MVVALAGNGSRPRRADARRNYERLLEQARAAFTESGVDASLDEIARRAGVASGTLYRHFPTRLDLVEAVLAERIGELVDLGRGLLDADDAFVAVSTWLRAALAHALTYRGLAAATMSAALDGGGGGAAAAWHAELFEVGSALLVRARHAGVIDGAADDADVLKMVGAIAWAVQDAPEPSMRAERLLAVVVNGLRPH
ncbi:TetR/AcrR family transcriptional regulator [Pseudonocardia lacus]|uniref:TetR/AcrR family transcriptional regulator n=1 Tax=Pseudonocardia lacus TaxID=2835865 RepID=UPI001BDCC09F|nr:TetR/AcrR family transcriptional regulator [Pseudonocardia lacus]